MKVLILAVLVAAAHAWINGPAPSCNSEDVESGTILMPHERYCQQFYTCDSDLNAVAHTCPDGLIFSYGVGLANCLRPENEAAVCVNWGCSQLNVGSRYPDNCCTGFWECTSDLRYTRFTCPAGQVFDSITEICTFPTATTCTGSNLCIDLIQPSTNNRCHDFANDDGNPCLYKTVFAGVTTPDRQCPNGAAFDSNTCQCSITEPNCNAFALTAAQMLQNKQFDAECRISRRVDFTFLPLTTFSDKLSVELRHYFRTSGVSTNNNEAVFQSGNAGTFIYDYFFNDNELFAPLAIAMTVRFDVIPNVGNTISLLSNDFSLDPNNNLCQPSTLDITARYEGLSNGQRVWTFGISAVGVNSQFATASNTINGDSNDYFRIVFTFNGQIAATVTNRGINNVNVNNNINTVSMGTTQTLGAKLRANKCGFVIGRGLTGRVREFNVYEGCGDFNRVG